MKKLINRLLMETGYQFKRYPDPYLVRRMKIINQYNIDTLFDIGANAGQYASEMRKLGYRKKIISFEPLKSAFKDLKKASSKDINWIINNYALGNEDTKVIINVSANSWSSSVLTMLPLHLKNAPGSEYITGEETQIRKLDSVFNSFYNKGDSVMLKIDTQGYEKKVLEGAGEFLRSVRIIQLEMSLVPLYETETLFIEMVNYLDNKGFQLFSLEDIGISDKTTGQLLEVDGIFVQKNIY